MNVSEATADRLRLLASAWEVDEEGAISRLIDRLAAGATEDPTPQSSARADQVEVYAVYDGRRVSGLYDPRTKALTVTSTPLEGSKYKSPSGAAIAVVQATNPKVNPNRNGWTFWTVRSTGDTLQSLRNR
ncbi:hypothetical protein UB45_11910 [Terrabacter sp. 28]|nr:hypothetical protein UB45_11910 [Terrabacter sp. 28]